MSNKLRLIGGLLCCAAVALFSACGGGGSDACQFSSDCASGEVCFTGGQSNQCVQECTEDGDCSSGTCTDQVEGSSMGCMPSGGTSADGGGNMFTDGGDMNDGGTSGCTNNSQCPGDQVCNTQGDGPGMCESVEPQNNPKFIAVKDITTQETGYDKCSSASDPGSDLFGARLINSDGDVVAWASLVAGSSNLKGGSNQNKRAGAIFNGSQPSLDGSGDNACPSGSFGSDTVVSLGCDGTLALKFMDGGSTVELEEGMTVAVHEYGAQCQSNPGSIPNQDHISIQLCETGTSSGDLAGGIDACSQVTKGTAAVSHSLTSEDISAARGN